MITKSITAVNQYSGPLYVSRGRILGLSISGTFTGTIELQRLPAEDINKYPLHSDSGFETYVSKTAIFAGEYADLAPGWYRVKATATITGTAVCKIW